MVPFSYHYTIFEKFFFFRYNNKVRREKRQTLLCYFQNHRKERTHHDT